MVLAAGPLHAICVVLTGEQREFNIGGWRAWARMLRGLNDAEMKVGVRSIYAGEL